MVTVVKPWSNTLEYSSIINELLHKNNWVMCY